MWNVKIKNREEILVLGLFVFKNRVFVSPFNVKFDTPWYSVEDFSFIFLTVKFESQYLRDNNVKIYKGKDKNNVLNIYTDKIFN